MSRKRRSGGSGVVRVEAVKGSPTPYDGLLRDLSRDCPMVNVRRGDTGEMALMSVVPLAEIALVGRTVVVVEMADFHRQTHAPWPPDFKVLKRLVLSGGRKIDTLCPCCSGDIVTMPETAQSYVGMKLTHIVWHWGDPLTASTAGTKGPNALVLILNGIEDGEYVQGKGTVQIHLDSIYSVGVFEISDAQKKGGKKK